MFLSDPLSSNILTMLLLELKTARCRGVKPSSSYLFNSTFHELKNTTEFSLPIKLAPANLLKYIKIQCNGVLFF